jgi:hypothetical protein
VGSAWLDLPHAVLLDDLAVEQDLPARAQVLDDVPVDLALVRAADLGMPLPSARWTVPSIFSSNSVFFMNA